MAKRAKTSLSLDPVLMNIVGHRCIDLRIGASDAVEEALRLWLSQNVTVYDVPGNVPKSTTQTGTDSEYVVLSASLNDGKTLESTILLDKLQKANTLFIQRIEGLFAEVPAEARRAAEEHIVRLAEVGVVPFVQGGFQREQSSGHRQLKAKTLQDLSGVAPRVSGKSTGTTGDD